MGSGCPGAQSVAHRARAAVAPWTEQQPRCRDGPGLLRTYRAACRSRYCWALTRHAGQFVRPQSSMRSYFPSAVLQPEQRVPRTDAGPFIEWSWSMWCARALAPGGEAHISQGRRPSSIARSTQSPTRSRVCHAATFSGFAARCAERYARTLAGFAALQSRPSAALHGRQRDCSPSRRLRFRANCARAFASPHFGQVFDSLILRLPLRKRTRQGGGAQPCGGGRTLGSGTRRESQPPCAHRPTRSAGSQSRGSSAQMRGCSPARSCAARGPVGIPTHR